MTFPDSDRIVFRQNPLQEVICQLRFPTILKISSQKPDSFQELIRQNYPHFDPSDDIIKLPAEITGIGSRITGRSVVEGNPIYKFAWEDGSRHISLNQDFVALTDNNYTKWHSFESEFFTVIEAFQEIYNPAFYNRISLRYIDVIDKSDLGLENRPWSDLLNSELSGILKAQTVGNLVQHYTNDVRIDLTEVEGACVHIRHGLLANNQNPQIYVIDSDFFFNGRIAKDNLQTTLLQFNRVAGNLFRWAISPELTESLGRDNLEQRKESTRRKKTNRRASDRRIVNITPHIEQRVSIRRGKGRRLETRR